MSFPQILEVAIGLILVYYILGAIVSTITQAITEIFETRGTALEKYLKKIAGSRVLDLTEMPRIRSLKPIRYKNWFSVFTADTMPKKVEKIPVSTLVDAFFDMACITGKKELSADELKDLVNTLPESESKTAILGWINQGITNIEDIRKRTNDYFCGILDQAAATFKANARSFVVILSIGLTLFFGTDSIQLTKDLWTNAELRAVAAARADVVVQQNGTQADLTNLLEDLSAFTVKIGWWQGQNFPQNATATQWVSFAFLKFIGLGLTAVAVSQGSSFWYDLLKRISGHSSAPSAPEESKG